jgi:hypothetical protein
MSYIANTASVIKFLLPSLDSEDFDVVDRKGIVTIDRWESPLVQPTEQEVATAAASQEYLDWYAENGGDPTKTRRKQAELLLSDDQSSNRLLRAVILTMVDEFNRHSARTNAILDAIDSSTNLASLRAAVGTINNIPARTGAQLRAAAINKIKAGEADS